MISKQYSKYLVPLGLVISSLAIAGGFGLIINSNMSLTSVQGSGGDFYTSSSWTPYADYTHNAQLYGNEIRVENFKVKDHVTEDVGKVHIGSFSKVVDLNEVVSHNGIVVEVTNAKDTAIYDGYPYSYNYDNNLALAWRLGINISKDKITADFKNVKVNRVSPGKYKVNYNVIINNDWIGTLKSDNIYVKGFNKKMKLPTKNISTGKQTYNMVMEYDDYKPSKYKVEKKVKSELQLVVEKPWIPFDKKYFGGAKSVENPDFGLDTIKSETKPVSFTLNYCGENASYQNGECVIDSQLHFRGDSCFMPQNYTMVTQSFTEGTVKLDELNPSPNYFCSRHPVDIINDGVQTDTSVTPYKELIKDGEFTVPEGQTYTLFWVVNANNADTVKFCDKGSYNKTSDKCVVTPGVIHKCTGDAVWSPEKGACVVNAETKHVCSNPTARFNAKIGKCVIQITDTKCPVGTVAGPQGKVCYAEASVKKVCPDKIKNGRVKAGKCISEAKVVLTQQNLIGDWMEALDNTWNAFVNWVPVI